MNTAEKRASSPAAGTVPRKTLPWMCGLTEDQPEASGRIVDSGGRAWGHYCVEIPKVDPKLLAKVVGKDRTIEQATRSEKRAASLGLHSLRHTNATAMDSLGIPQQIRKQRLGHSGGSMTENYTHTFTADEREAAEKLGELFGAGWPEIDKGKLISFPSLSQKEEGLPVSGQEARVNQ